MAKNRTNGLLLFKPEYFEILKPVFKLINNNKSIRNVLKASVLFNDYSLASASLCCIVLILGIIADQHLDQMQVFQAQKDNHVLGLVTGHYVFNAFFGIQISFPRWHSTQHFDPT